MRALAIKMDINHHACEEEIEFNSSLLVGF